MTRRRSRLVGRMSENRCIAGVLEDARDRVGGVVTVQGTPGVGKTRLVQESMSAATQRGFDVFFTYCESHAREISFNVISRLLRAVFAIGGVEPTAARSMVRADIDDADDQDLLLLYDMLGIGETDMPLPDVSPDARRRRLIDLMSKISLARSRPTVYVIEDVHWIDEVSESMLAEFGRAIIRAKATILITYRPEYRGALSRIDGATTIELAPLPDVDTQELVRELLGADPSVDGLVAVIVHRAAGIPFCAEEIIRDLAERGEIAGTSGNYTCDREVDDVQVPATLQAAIGARIDRLDATAKRTLNAAAVMGVRFRADLVERLVGSADWKPLVEGQLVDVLHGAGDGEYAFHHPSRRRWHTSRSSSRRARNCTDVRRSSSNRRMRQPPVKAPPRSPPSTSRPAPGKRHTPGRCAPRNGSERATSEPRAALGSRLRGSPTNCRTVTQMLWR